MRQPQRAFPLAARQRRGLHRRGRIVKRMKDDVAKSGRLRVRHQAQELQRHQGRRPPRVLRDQGLTPARCKSASAGRNRLRQRIRFSVRTQIQTRSPTRLPRRRPDPARSGRTDPRPERRRVGMVTSREVEVRPTICHAKVYFSPAGRRPAENEAALNQAAGFPAQRPVQAPAHPHRADAALHFDRTTERAADMNALIVPRRSRAPGRD